MKRTLIATLFAGALTLAAFPAFATFCPDGSPWPKNPNGSWVLNSDGSHYCPTPTPAPTPSPVTSGSTSNAAAQAAAVADAQAAATSTSGVKGSGNSDVDVKVDAKGGAGGTSAVKDSGNSQSAATGGSVKDSGNSKATGGAGGAGGSGTGGNVGTVSPTATATGNGSGNTLGGGSGTSSATGNGAGNITTTNNNSTTTYKQVEVPVLFNPVPPSTSPTGLMIKETLACGPLQQVVKTPVSGMQVGIFKNTQVDLGYDYELVPVIENGEQVYFREREFLEGGARVFRRFGTQAVIVYALPNVSGASSFSIGGAGNNGGGSGGAGASSAMQRIVDRINIFDCELPGGYKLVEVPKTAALSRDEVLGALAQARILLNIPTTTVVEGEGTCKQRDLVDPKTQEKVSTCINTSGKFRTKKLISGSVPVTGTIELGVAGKAGSK